ncbi:MAG: glycosyltransferase [Candidatus Cloacimonetes bacterium]|nr:glycosyltransferase [Candidatus Cloacimonadota bacterium]
MKNGVSIVSTCKMGPGTFEAKFTPLSMVEEVSRIIVVRKITGPKIPKLEYIILPKISSNPLMNFILAVYEVVRQVKKSHARFILAYHYMPYFFIAYTASIISGKPYILGQTGTDVQRFVEKPVLGWVLRHIIHKAYSFNVPGCSSLEYWKRIGFSNVRVLHSTIDTSRFVPDDSAKEFEFLFLGRLETYKGVHHIIRALSSIVKDFPDTTLAIVGYGPYEAELRSLVHAMNLTNNVNFHGYQADTYTYYRKAKIFVMASETEGLPCALMEAMSCELLCISTLVGNIGDILKDGVTGFSYDSGDVDKLNKLMRTSLVDYEKYRYLRENGRKRIVAEHSYEFAISLWEKLIVGFEGKDET